MSLDFGAVPAGSVLPVHFGSYNSAGASVALTGLAVTDVEIYKGASVTQRSSDAGIALIDTDGIDIDTIVGANGFSIDTGDNTDAGFYAVGSFFNVWVSAVTIDAQTVNFLAATFRIIAAEAVAGVPKVDLSYILGTALTETAGQIAAAFKKFFNIATPAATMDHGVLVDTVTTYTGNTPQTGDSFARIGAAGASLTALGDTRIANLDAAVTTRMATYTQPTGFLAASFPTDPADESLIIAATDALATLIGDVPTNTEMAAAFTEIKGATWSVTDTLEAIRDRGDAAWTTAVGFSTHTAADVWAVATRILTAGTNIGFPSASTIATAVWDVLTSALTTVGSIGKLLVDNINATISSRSTYAGADTAGTTTLLSRIASALTITTGKVDVNDKTGFKLASDGLAAVVAWTVAITGNITGALSGSVGSVTAGVTLAASAVQAIWDAATSALTTVGSIGKWILDKLDAAISSRSSQASVDDVPTNAELATAVAPLATAANLATVASYVDTEITTIINAIAALNDLSAAEIRTAIGLAAADLDAQLATAKGTTQITESYAANGVAPTRDQAVMAIHQMLMAFDIIGTALSVKKLDGTTPAFAVTLDSATAPTSAARS